MLESSSSSRMGGWVAARQAGGLVMADSRSSAFRLCYLMVWEDRGPGFAESGFRCHSCLVYCFSEIDKKRHRQARGTR